MPVYKEELDIGDAFVYPNTLVGVPTRPPPPDASDPAPPADPTSYVLPDIRVRGMLAGRSVVLKLYLQRDVTAYELQIIQWLHAKRIIGNAMACILQEGLIRHFQEVDEQEEVAVLREQLARTAEKQRADGMYNSPEQFAEANKLLDDMKKAQVEAYRAPSLTMRMLRDAIDLIPGMKYPR